MKSAERWLDISMIGEDCKDRKRGGGGCGGVAGRVARVCHAYFKELAETWMPIESSPYNRSRREDKNKEAVPSQVCRNLGEFLLCSSAACVQGAFLSKEPQQQPRSGPLPFTPYIQRLAGLSPDYTEPPPLQLLVPTIQNDYLLSDPR